ncbi:MAG: hypothetical protein LUD68_01200 [Rikenellaceae bacterium]|nr:hypothetical protein [Rikenellaceae bacterium]
MKNIVSLLLFALTVLPLWGQEAGTRKIIPLHGRQQLWKSIAHDTDPAAYAGFENATFDDSA